MKPTCDAKNNSLKQWKRKSCDWPNNEKSGGSCPVSIEFTTAMNYLGTPVVQKNFLSYVALCALQTFVKLQTQYFVTANGNTSHSLTSVPRSPEHFAFRPQKKAQSKHDCLMTHSSINYTCLFRNLVLASINLILETEKKQYTLQIVAQKH